MRESRKFEVRPVRHMKRGECRIVSENDFRLVADRIEDLSTFGMLAGPADPVITGEKVFVSFQLPSTGEWFDVKAIVTRVVHGRRPGETKRKVGLEFVEMKPYDRYRLRCALSATPSCPPGIRPGRRIRTDLMAALAQ